MVVSPKKLSVVRFYYHNETTGSSWPSDAELEKLRAEFLRVVTDADRKRVAAAAQERALTIGTHAVLGEYFQPVVARKNLTGYVNAPVYVYWNLDKK